VQKGMKTCPSCGHTHPLGARDCAWCGCVLVLKPGCVVAGRFRIEDLIASGGMSQVYRAYQTRMRRQVALKVVPPPVSGNWDPQEALVNEAFLAGQVSHPNIVSVFEHGEFEGGHSYLAMEYLHGRTIAQALRDEGPFGPARTIRLLFQVCEALSAIHKLGLIHRDIKPSNIFLVGMEGERDFVKLLDFGLVTVARPAWSWFRGRGRTGTILYMSPEQIRGDALDERSDLYALGAVAYEMLTGRPVFTGEDPLQEHLKSIPTPISIAAPAVRIPRALDDLILRLLSKDPRHRPRDAGEVLLRLRRLFSAGTPAGSGVRESAPEEPWEWAPPVAMPRRLHLRDPDFVGRAREQEAFQEAVAKVREGHSAVLWFFGDRGTGKSALQARLASQAAESGLRTAASSISGQGPILGAWRPIVTGLLELRDPSRDDIRSAISQRFGIPETDFVAEGAADLVAPSPDIRERLHQDRSVFVAFLQAALESLLRRFSASGPLAIFLDDFHLTDPDSAAFLDRLVQGLHAQPAPILVVVLSTPLPRAPGGEFRDHHRALATVRLNGEVFSLSRLTDAEVVALLDAMSPVECSPAVRRVIRRAAAGNPLFAIQMFRHLASRGAFTIVRNRLAIASGADLSVPEVLMELIGARLEELRRMLPDGVAAEEVLTRVALLGPWATVRTLWELLDREGRHDLRDALDPILDRLVSEGFLNRVPWAGDDMLVPSHPLFSEAIRARPVDSSGLRLRLLIAQVLEATQQDRLGPVAADIGRLYVETGYLDRAVDYLILAAEEAGRQMNLIEALAQYAKAEECLLRLDVPPEDERRWQVSLALAELRFVTGEHREVETRLNALAKLKGPRRDGRARLRVLELFARLEEARHQADRAIQFCMELVKVAREAGDRHPLARGLLLAANIRMDQGRNAEAARLIDEADEQVRPDETSRTMGLIHLARGRLFHKLGTSEQCLGELKAALEILSGPMDFAERAEALFFLGARLVFLERREEAMDAFREGAALCERVGFARGLAAHLANLGTCLAHQGRVAEARDLILRSQELREKMGDRRGVAHSLTALSDLALLEQNFPLVLDLAEKVLSICRDHAYPFGRRIALANIGQACLALGRLPEAEKAFRDCLGTLQEDRTVDPSIPTCHMSLANILQERGEDAEALRHRLRAIELFEHLERYEDADRLRSQITALQRR